MQMQEVIIVLEAIIVLEVTTLQEAIILQEVITHLEAITLLEVTTLQEVIILQEAVKTTKKDTIKSVFFYISNFNFLSLLYISLLFNILSKSTIKFPTL